MRKSDRFSWIKKGFLLLLCILIYIQPVEAASRIDRKEIESLVNGIENWKKESNGVSKNNCLFSSSFSEKAGNADEDYYALGVGRFGSFEDYAAYLEGIEDFVSKEYQENSRFSRYKVTEWQRIALTVLALGGDPADVGQKEDGTPVNLIADSVYNKKLPLGSQGIYGYVWALITVDSLRYKIPDSARDNRESIITAILQEQSEDGGFILGEEQSDVELTAVVLQALAPYCNSSESYTYTLKETGEKVTKTVRQAVDEALSYLSEKQGKSGDYSSGERYIVKTSAQVMIALCSLGIDPFTDERFVKDGNTLFDAILLYRTKDGGFAYSYDSTEEHPVYKEASSSVAAEQVLLSLSALYRYEDGQRILYDFRKEMPDELKQQIQELMKKIDSLSVETKDDKQYITGLFKQYMSIPAAERSYVYNYGLLAKAMEENGVEDTSESSGYLTSVMGINEKGNGYSPNREYEKRMNFYLIVVLIVSALSVVILGALYYRKQKHKRMRRYERKSNKYRHM